jgi:hypothetical protein
MSKEKDYNHVKEWMEKKLAERQMSTNRLVLLTGNRINNASIFRWYNDTFRPTAEKMQIICETLSKLPILEEGRPPRYEDVPLREAMAQFSEKPRSDRTKALTPRGRR